MSWICIVLLVSSVEERQLENTRTLQVSAGGVWLSRFDAYASPGVGATLTHYLDRSFALDYLNAAYFFSSETAEARRVREQTGYQSDREMPRALLGVGARYAFGYGKLLIEHTQLVVHFVPELSLHVGGLLTHMALRPSFDAGVGLRVGFGRSVRLVFEYHFVGDLETGQTRFVAGGMPRLQLGASF